ncbi:MAG: alpha-galactosidase [Clostridia bacterium]|nr:alpha-galactosidase [Clostridia bacterium]
MTNAPGMVYNTEKQEWQIADEGDKTMQIYRKDETSIDFAEGVLQIGMPAFRVEVNGNEGILQNGERTWRFVQPEKILGVTLEPDDNGGRSVPFMRLVLQYANGSENWYFYPDLPFLCTDCHPDGRSFRLSSTHVQLTSVEFVDRTDHYDSLVKESVHQCYKIHKAKGNMFLFDDYVNTSGLLIVKHSPCPDSAVRRAPEGDLILDYSGNMTLKGCGYGAAYGVGKPDTLFAAYKKLYGSLCRQPEVNFIMSNTWGDRSRDSAMKESFVLRELDCAHHLGVDIVQLDDGWQKGISSNSSYAAQNRGGVFEGFWDFDKDFWVLDPVKFPGGMDVILQKAEELGIDMGFWFAPDSADDFANWQKDVEVIRTLTEEHGAKYIKLDGVVLRTEACETNYLAMLDAISKLREGKLQFNLDITNDERLGYFCGIPYGTLFVENRYTDWGNYYPHRTLRNLWQLSRYIPAGKFQFEVLNPRRNTEKYGDDPLAPATYDIDWCFASVMASNPLIWMEMQHLSGEDTEALRKIIAVYRTHRETMAAMPVEPIGELPNGICWSGFHWNGGESGYITVFRGITDEDTHTFALPDGEWKLLHSNTDVEIKQTETGLQVSLGKKRSYAFLQYKA